LFAEETFSKPPFKLYSEIIQKQKEIKYKLEKTKKQLEQEFQEKIILVDSGLIFFAIAVRGRPQRIKELYCNIIFQLFI
jgi:hypothetical protein